MRNGHTNGIGSKQSLHELMNELESWLVIYVSTTDDTSAQVARHYMINAHAKLWTECRRRRYRKMAKLDGTALSRKTVAAARALPIEIVLERHFGVKLDRHGRGRCPFHGGTNPQSLHRLPSANRVFCHVCQRSWDPIGALMTLEGIGFRKAVEVLTSS